jgi:hypothetical protein
LSNVVRVAAQQKAVDVLFHPPECGFEERPPPSPA